MGLALHWGIKSSFLEYVTRLPDGTADASGGARPHGGGFLFPAVPDTEWLFSGTVRFRGYGGMLDVTVADPCVAPDGTRWTVYVGEQPGEPRASATPFARFELPGIDTLAFQAGVVLPVPRITTLGARILGDVYRPGTEVDPLFLVAAG